MLKINSGLNIPITGEPNQLSCDSKAVKSVAIVGADYIGMKPTMQVEVGQKVKKGEVLFTCKKNLGLKLTAPAAGTIKSIMRGEKRFFEVIDIDLSEQDEQINFESYAKKPLADWSQKDARSLLVESGLWAMIRERPFDKIAPVEGEAANVFVSVLDTNPLSFEPFIVIEKNQENFSAGLKILSLFASEHTYLNYGKFKPELKNIEIPNLKLEQIQGKHPAGNVGTQMHYLAPVSPDRKAWHVGYQDVITIGHFFLTGELNYERYFSLAGPRVKNPRLIKSRFGANIEEIVKDEIEDPDSTRVVSGSVLNGRTVCKSFYYAGPYTNQISALKEDRSRDLLGWHMPGFTKYSTKGIFVSALAPFLKFPMGTSTHGSSRAIVPVEMFEDINPFELLPTPLLKALVSKDTDSAQELGALELAEEDMALFTFVSPGKIDFGKELRENLTIIEKDG